MASLRERGERVRRTGVYVPRTNTNGRDSFPGRQCESPVTTLAQYPAHHLALDQFAGLVQVVIDDRVGLDADRAKCCSATGLPGMMTLTRGGWSMQKSRPPGPIR